MAYSPFFQVLHDERSPVGNLGRGTHYSVVRTLLPVTEEADPQSIEERIFGAARRRKLEMFNLAIIWDEDHDERIWDVIERLYTGGLLAPVRFIGERKGTITVICDPTMDYGSSGFEPYRELIEEIASAVDGDEWSAEVIQGIGNGSGQIIHDSNDRVDAYLHGIEASWTLGPIRWCKAS